MADIYVTTAGNDSTGNGTSGSPYASPGKAAGVMSGADRMCVQTGTYPITTATFNVAGGCVKPPAGTSGGISRIVGYHTTPGDITAPDQSNNPVFQASGITSADLVNLSLGAIRIENITLDVNSCASTNGINGGGTTCTTAYNCAAINGTGSGYGITSLISAVLSYAKTGFAAGLNGMYHCLGCAAISCNIGFYGNVAAVDCIAESNATDGFVMTGVIYYRRCVSHANTNNGFSFSGLSGGVVASCLAEGHTGVGKAGFLLDLSYKNVMLLNCGGYNNTSNYSSFGSADVVNFQALSASGMVSPGTGTSADFSVNNTGGAGALLRAKGLMAAGYPYFTLTKSFEDIGASQHQDSGGGGPAYFAY